MHRTTTMAFGFFLIFLGIQLNVVERYIMTPRTANFISSNGTGLSVSERPVETANSAYDSPYYQASYQPTQAIRTVEPVSREIRPPRWLCWPVLFLGAVILINGLTLRRN